MPTMEPYPWKKGYKPLPQPEPPKQIEVTIDELLILRRHIVTVPVKTTVLDALHDAYDQTLAKMVDESGDTAKSGHVLQQMGWKKVEVE